MCAHEMQGLTGQGERLRVSLCVRRDITKRCWGLAWQKDFFLTVSVCHLQAVMTSRNQRVSINVFHSLLISPFSIHLGLL